LLREDTEELTNSVELYLCCLRSHVFSIRSALIRSSITRIGGPWREQAIEVESSCQHPQLFELPYRKAAPLTYISSPQSQRHLQRAPSPPRLRKRSNDSPEIACSWTTNLPYRFPTSLIASVEHPQLRIPRLMFSALIPLITPQSHSQSQTAPVLYLRIRSNSGPSLTFRKIFNLPCLSPVLSRYGLNFPKIFRGWHRSPGYG